MHVNLFGLVCFLYCYNATKKVMLKELIQIDTELPEIYARIQFLEKNLNKKIKILLNLEFLYIKTLHLKERSDILLEETLKEYVGAARKKQSNKSICYKEKIEKMLAIDKEKIQNIKFNIIECRKVIREQKIKAKSKQKEKDKLIYKIFN
ncbi:hypothetical protein BDAP_000336 [Binucleata daphniae]